MKRQPREIKRGLFRLIGTEHAGVRALKRAKRRIAENEMCFYAAEGQGWVPAEARRQLDECLMQLAGKLKA
jgi:hypothetical protein